MRLRLRYVMIEIRCKECEKCSTSTTHKLSNAYQNVERMAAINIVKLKRPADCKRLFEEM